LGMAESTDAEERSRGLFIVGASSEPVDAARALSELCREAPTARALEMLGCMFGFMGEYSQVPSVPFRSFRLPTHPVLLPRPSIVVLSMSPM
jgi:hypothetical protein